VNVFLISPASSIAPPVHPAVPGRKDGEPRRGRRREKECTRSTKRGVTAAAAAGEINKKI
jgi:hypothetical protein